MIFLPVEDSRRQRQLSVTLRVNLIGRNYFLDVKREEEEELDLRRRDFMPCMCGVGGERMQGFRSPRNRATGLTQDAALS
jgi:hypothetical protein